MSRTAQSVLLISWMVLITSVRANQPPRFEVDGDQQSEILIKLKEGSETPVGTLIHQVRAADPDGDLLQFGLHGKDANELLKIETVNATHANLYLKKLLDREVSWELLYFFFMKIFDSLATPAGGRRIFHRLDADGRSFGSRQLDPAEFADFS